ncbi:transposase [Microlunatus aurantiacus]|uniref:transposase n=1 Tax=Microlunatus aurantiacus TaxID=446786 RepID=UPI003CD0A491
MAVEIGDWTRFSGASIGAFVGLTPSEHSSGASRSLGSITKDRQRSRPPAAGRSRVASPVRVSAGKDDAGPVGAGPSSGAGPR